MSTTTHETEITSDPTVPLVRITREFDAPAEKVFRAHSDPDLVVSGSGLAATRCASTTTTAAPAARTVTCT